MKIGHLVPQKSLCVSAGDFGYASFEISRLRNVPAENKTNFYANLDREKLMLGRAPLFSWHGNRDTVNRSWISSICSYNDTVVVTIETGVIVFNVSQCQQDWHMLERLLLEHQEVASVQDHDEKVSRLLGQVREELQQLGAATEEGVQLQSIRKHVHQMEIQLHHMSLLRDNFSSLP